jgi:hypothetical protein
MRRGTDDALRMHSHVRTATHARFAETNAKRDGDADGHCSTILNNSSYTPTKPIPKIQLRSLFKTMNFKIYQHVNNAPHCRAKYWYVAYRDSKNERTANAQAILHDSKKNDRYNGADCNLQNTSHSTASQKKYLKSLQWIFFRIHTGNEERNR